MPHRFQDRLLPGETLRVGESLISMDNRFHLYLEDDGDLVAYSYSQSGVKRFWRAGSTAGPNATLELGYIPHHLARHIRTPALIIKNKDGLNAWVEFSKSPLYPSTNWENLYFQMQSHGNMVLYVKSLTQPDVVRYVFGTDTYKLWEQKIAIPPNVKVCDVFLPPGSLVLGSAYGDTEIVNKRDSRPIAVQAGTQVVGLHPGESVSCFLPGTVLVSTTTYEFADLRAADGTPPKFSDEACAALVSPPRPGERVLIEINDFPCFLTRGQFSGPGLESFKDLVLVGELLPKSCSDCLPSAPTKETIEVTDRKEQIQLGELN